MDTIIRFRVATSEKELFEEFATGEGLTLSEWVRAQLYRATAGKPHVPAGGVTKSVRPAPNIATEPPCEPRTIKSPTKKGSVKPSTITEAVRKGRGSIKRSVDIPKPDWKT